MPSRFFDHAIFGDLILNVHQHKEQVFFVTRSGDEYQLPQAIYDEAFRVWQPGADGIPVEMIASAVKCREEDMPFQEVVDHGIRIGLKKWRIASCQPNGYGWVTLILSTRV